MGIKSEIRLDLYRQITLSEHSRRRNLYTLIALEQTAALPRALSLRAFSLSGASLYGLGVLVAVIGVVFLRAFYLARSFDIFIDEITYLHISRSIADTLQVKLYGEGFYLHPPAYFIVEAAYLKFFQVGGSILEQIYAVRYLNVAFAALTALAIHRIAYHVAGRWAGMIALLIFALDPFIIKMNSYNLLDTSALWWVVAGYWVLVPGLVHHTQTPPFWQQLPALRKFVNRFVPAATLGMVDAPRSEALSLPLWRIGVAGLFFGLALLTKDMTFFLTLLPLGLCFVWGWPLQRKVVALIGSIASLLYALYPLTIWMVGEWHLFEVQKLHGIKRLAGILKVTGVNRAHGPSLFEIILARLDQFGTTYLILALGLVGIVVLFVFGRAASHLIVAWVVSAYALLAYAVLFGTLEEQFFYMLMLPCLVTVAIGAGLLQKSGAMQGRIKVAAQFVALVFALFFVVWSGLQWGQRHLAADNGHASALRFLQQNLLPAHNVAATDETSQFLLGDYGSGPWGSWHTVEELESFALDYVLVSPHSLAWDFGNEADALLMWVECHGEPLFEFQGNGDNEIVLYRLEANDACVGGQED